MMFEPWQTGSVHLHAPPWRHTVGQPSSRGEGARCGNIIMYACTPRIYTYMYNRENAALKSLVWGSLTLTQLSAYHRIHTVGRLLIARYCKLRGFPQLTINNYCGVQVRICVNAIIKLQIRTNAIVKRRN